MNRAIIFLTALVVLGGGALSASAQSHFTARLTGDQEIPAVATGAEGSAAFVLTGAGLQFFITVDGLSGPITAAHIHQAEAGVNGGVVRNLSFSGNGVSGIWSSTDSQPLTAALIETLTKGDLYVNVHTAANPAGEIRGQITPTSGVHLSAHLTGAQENPPLGVPGQGVFTGIMTDLGLVYEYTVVDLTGAPTAAHIHESDIGRNGGVVVSLATPTPDGAGFIPASSFTAAQIRDILSGRTYVNVHTAANPGGEIRGQILVDSGTGFVTSLTGSEEVPPNASPGRAVAVCNLTPQGLAFDITATGLSGPITAAHFHRGPAGANGPAVRDILAEFGGGTTAYGFWGINDSQPLARDLIQELLLGNLYVNLHTAAFPGGEIRGQVKVNQASLATTLVANLSSYQEQPPLVLPGSGTAAFTLTPAGLAFEISVDNLTGPILAAHFHLAPIGTNGGVLQNITASFTGNYASGLWALGASDVTDLLLGNIYVNIHTAANPGGEIRGQILPASGAALAASFTSFQETPPLNLPGHGTGFLRMTQAGLTFRFTAAQLTGAITGAHFHGGERGVPGGVLRGLTASELVGNNAAGVWKPGDAQPLDSDRVARLMEEGIYLNLHTAANPGGEIRGQVTLAGGSGYSAHLLGGSEVPANPSSGRGVLSATLTDLGLVFRVTASDLDGAFVAAHFHNAPPGSNGPVVRDIGPDFSGLTADGFWSESDAQALTLALRNELIARDIYVNLHTDLYPGGEIRGNLYLPDVSSVENNGPGAGLLDLRVSPNPFRSASTVSFNLTESAPVTLRLYDISGRQVAVSHQGTLVAGRHRIDLSGEGLPGAVYFYRLEAGSVSGTGKLVRID